MGNVKAIIFQSLLVLLNGPNKTDYSYEIFHNLISNLFSMGDLKLFAQYYNELKDIVAIINKFSDDIAIKFYLDKL